MKHPLFSKYFNMLLALSAITLMTTFFYGYRILYLIAIGIITSYIIDKIMSFIFAIKKTGKFDLSFMITPMIITLLMPANVPVYIIVLGCIIAMVVAVYPFGGNGFNIFNPAGVAVGFITISFPDIVNNYPILTSITNANISTVPTVSSHIINLRVGGTPNIDMFDLLLGRFTGPMGTTFIVVISACLLFLLATKTIPLSIVLSTGVTTVIGFMIFTNSLDGSLENIIYHICCSTFLFSLTFMACDPVTSPNKVYARVIYGVVLGALFILYQYFGATVNTFVFPLLIVNALAHTFDNHETGYKEFFSKIFFRKNKKLLNSITPIDTK